MPNTPLKGDYNTYIGARYVPIIGGMWNQQTEYEPLTIVMYQGSSFTSKTFVPKGTQIDNTTYWVRTANYDEQVEFYRSEVQQFKKDIDASEAEYIATVQKAQSEYEASITKRQNDYENNLTVRQNNYETKITSEVQQFKEDIDASEAEYIATVKKAQSEYEDSITKQQNDYENNLTVRQNEYEASLQGQIATVSNNLTTEITNRKNADTTLQGQITTEITDRENADTTLQGNINSEASTRASADSNLQSQINQIVAPSGEAPSAAEVQNARIGADGLTYDTLGESIRGNDNELKQMINIPDEDMEVREYLYWNRLINSSDAAIYATNYLYEPGYIKKAHVKIIGDTDQTGALYAYTKNGNDYDLWGKLCDFTGHGEIVVTVNKNIDKKFILAFSCNKLAYKTGVTSKYNSAYFGTLHPTISGASFSNNLSFAVGVIYDRLIDTVNEIQTVKILPDFETRYPIVWDFENSELKVKFTVIKPKNRGLSTFFNGSYSISITQGTYKNLFLVYDENADSLEVVEGEGASILPTNLMNKYVVAGISGNGLRFSIYSINSEMVKVIHKRTVDKETFPLYAKRRIYTLPIIENKWFNCDGVFLGDSLTLGQNPDDNYNAMLDDNISAIAKEELGLFQGYNYGIGGALISGSSSNSFINRYSDMFDYSNVKLVCVWGGTNDFYHGVDLGSMSDVSDNTKFIPALYNLIDGLLKKYKNNKAQIVVISPPHLYGSEDGYKEDIPRNGYVLKDLVDAMDDVCNYFGVPFCNLYKTIGFTPRISDVKTLYQPDGVHFNVNGSRQYACNRIVNFIKSEL